MVAKFGNQILIELQITRYIMKHSSTFRSQVTDIKGDAILAIWRIFRDKGLTEVNFRDGVVEKVPNNKGGWTFNYVTPVNGSVSVVNLETSLPVDDVIDILETLEDEEA